MADLDPCIGSEQGGIRPVVIIQNNTGNRFSTTTIVAPITTKLGKAYLSTHLVISKRTGIYKKSMILLEQIRIIERSKPRIKYAPIIWIEITKIKIIVRAILKFTD